MYVKWDEQYRMGIPRFDRQREELLVTLNLLMSIVNKADEYADGGFAETCEKFAALMNYHFVQEEQELEKQGYPDLKQHVDEHDELRLTFGHFNRVYHYGRRSQAQHLAMFFKKWFVLHISLSDKQYGRFIDASSGVSARLP